MQQWFERSILPTSSLGLLSRSDLNSIDLDFQAVGRHAAGVLLSKGHRRMCLVSRHPLRAGDRLTESGFCAALAAHALPPARLYHDGTAKAWPEA